MTLPMRNRSARPPLADEMPQSTALSHPRGHGWNQIHSIAIVDVARLTRANPPKTNDTEAKKEAMRVIESAISSRASAHAFSLVFDISGNSLNGAPVVLGAPKAIDLTEELQAKLARESKVK
jgi:hypothetical protein